ncbi:flagellar protein FlgN [Pseudodesulfovibrio senegalensis]|uniref:Flagellar protein FlgN n=2 Tax=Pseudodesulfovibrio senegalensis TaxID=1721087 RepID=A0A6N6N231_9BACT|nr:flagellar export chaperone FlgN [Pseudodesulfovibrio senegalensis]KAB1440251.1 flagellar protein FlgN [Pseudodesulfovibrio senegalensis]
MFTLLEENLVRQNKAIMLLSALLEEEFARLQKRNPRGVSRIELSIQELLRQIAAERFSLKRMCQAIDPEAEQVHMLYSSMDETTQQAFGSMLAMLDKMEQKCGLQAAKNQELAQALLDQSSSLLNFMHKEIQPKKRDAYSARGRFVGAGSSQATILRGRL